jgi:NAD+ diphosphatase
MSNKGNPMKFIPGIVPAEGEYGDGLWFVFHGSRMLVKIDENSALVPYKNELEKLELNIVRSQYLGALDGVCCYSAELTGDMPEVAGMEFMDLRTFMGMTDTSMFTLAGRAFQIVEWDRTHQYCGKCGTKTETKKNERAKACPKCGYLSFPRISPAIIVAITNGDKILLAHNNNFKSNFYSVIAGFVEPGETFEECVAREVMEEVGIEIKDIKYFGSQPWPFPHSMMVAFTAEYARGEINVDGVEIGDAGWYSADNLPSIPAPGSVARKLIDWFVENNKKRF